MGCCIGQIPDSMPGHLQIHHKGYVASIETLPLTLNMKTGAAERVKHILDQQPEIAAHSPRIKFGGMFSNFVETTNIRLVAVYPEREFATVPLLPARIIEGEKTFTRGEILVPTLLAKGMGVKVGDTVVVVATNKDGSVNGKQFRVSGVIEGITGPGGRDGYLHIEDAAELLRMEEPEVSEVAVRMKDFSRLHRFAGKIEGLLSGELNKQGKPLFEVHSWELLTPFSTIARMNDMMTFFIKLMLVAIVLIQD